MRVAEVVGKLTLNRCHPSFDGATLKLAIPLSLQDLTSGQPPQADTVVVYDQLGANLGHQILLSEGAEAAQPFRPQLKPVDAYNAGIIDEIDLHPDVL